MGRRQIPDEIKIADGTYRKDLSGDPEERVPAKGLPTPGELSGGALDAWNELIPPLIELGIVKEIDGVVLRGMCRWYAEYLKQAAVMDLIEGLEAASEQYRRAALGALQAWKEFERTASLFAMSSSGRSGVRLPKEKKGVAARKRG